MASSSTRPSARSPELQKQINEVQSRLTDFIESTRPAHEANLRHAAQNTLRTPNKPEEKTDPPKNPRPCRSAALTDAKKILRAATAATSKSLAAPQFVHRTPEIARHRRKCAICHHPEREAIEDLFIHWHSPEAIASHYEEDDESITWISIYRHAYAFGLDEIRRRNLRFVFEHILDQAGTTAATPASIIVAARALGSCVNENGQWNDPPKRVLVTNIIRNEPPQTAPPAQIENHANSENNVACVGADSLYRPASSLTSPSAGAPSFASSAKGGSSQSVPDQIDAFSGQRSLSSDNQSGL